jgi:hypothetical protein
MDKATKKTAAKKKPQTARAAAAEPPPPGDPIGCCRFVNSAGQPDCIDGVTRTECSKHTNFVFIPGGSCV